MMGEKDPQEQFYYGLSLEKMVPPDDFYRKVEEVVDFGFIRRLCRPLYSHTGKPSIDPVVFFKTELVGFLENVTSDRKLARLASDRLSLRRFLKYDLDEEFVWHSTISRTRQMMPERIYDEIFQAVLAKCVEAGLVEGRHVVVDTALIAANASLESLERKKPRLSVTEHRLRAIEENPCDKPQGNEGPGGGAGLAPAPEGRDKKQKDGQKTIKRDNKNWESTTDPDAKIARKRGKPADMYYKDAIAVDPKKNVVTAVEGVTADVADQQTLEPVVDAAVKNLEANGLKPDTVIGDSGFYSGENLKAMEDKGLQALMPEQRNKPPNAEGKFGVDDFKYFPAKNEYTCPAGKILQPDGTKTIKGARYFKYRAKGNVCQECEIRRKCTDAEGARVLSVSEYQPFFEAHRKRMTPRNSRRARRIQRGSVEPAFGEAINFCGNRRVNTMGIGGARKKFIMCAAAQNLKKLIKYGGLPAMAAACKVKAEQMADKMAGFLYSIFGKNNPTPFINPLLAY